MFKVRMEREQEKRASTYGNEPTGQADEALSYDMLRRECEVS